MRGWVYVISNKAMPGLVKVGFSTKDSELRAEDLNHTGSPHPYEVEYDMLIENPYEIEQKTHQLLSSKLEGREWFRCSAEEAIAAIKQVSGTRAISESYKRAERAKAEALYQRELEAIELRRQQEKEQDQRELEVIELRRKREKEQKDLEERLRNEEAIIRKKFDEQIAVSFPPRPFWVYWLGTGILVFIGLVNFNPKMSDIGLFMSSAFVGALAGWWLMSYLENKRKQSSSYVALEKQRDEELAAVRERIPLQPTKQPVAPTNENNAAKSQEHEDMQMYRQAAMQGIPSAQVFLGMMYLNGTRLPQDDDQAVAWFRKAAKQGNAEGQYRLGWMYKLGRGVLQDPVKAYVWGSLAVMNGESRADEMCEEIAKWLTPKREREAQEMVQKCRESYYQNCD